MLLAALALLGVAAAAAPLLTRALGRDAGYVLAALVAVVGGLVTVSAPAVLAGEVVAEGYGWIPSLGVGLELRLDALALLFAAIVLGVGVLVLVYTARYLAPADGGARLYTLLTLFAAAMLGLVLAADLIALFVFWELTSVCSYLLIAGDGMAGRRPALRAFLVTGAGGLALFGGLVLLAVLGGTFSVPELFAGREAILAHDAALVAAVLVAVGAFTKSAQVPFHFWLPGAMVAPTPVSTYLHAATMVKAGIYLLARFTPLFAGVTLWTTLLVGVGLTTALLTALFALKATDLKALLAYSTTSMLGFLIALIGLGTYEALAAAGLLTLAHAAYKATLFMVVGIVDHEAGTRDIRELSGLRRAMPATAGVATLGAASMAGLPPLLGFVGKEEAYTAFLGAPGGTLGAAAVLAVAVAVAVATFGYSWRFLHGTFAGPDGGGAHRPSTGFLVAPAVTAVLGLGLGLVLPALDPLVGGFAADATGLAGETHLALWHGIGAPLGLSVLTIALGLALFVARRPVEQALLRVRSPWRGTGGFDRVYDGSVALGRRLGDPFVPDAPVRHLALVLAVAVGAGLLAGLASADSLVLAGHPDTAGDLAVAVLLAVALVGLAVARDRLAAVALLGAVGFLVAVFYVLAGAPDLALTQLLIETLTVVLVVLVFRRLPRRFLETRPAQRRVAVGVAVLAGGVAALGAAALTGQRVASPAARYFLSAAPTDAGGENVVNTILVDFRALDTLGEITVLAVAAVGIFALTGLARRRDAEAGR